MTAPAREADGVHAGRLDPPDGRAYELWDFGMWSPIIRSTVYEGLYCVGNAVLEGTFHAAGSRRGSRGQKEQL